MTKQKLEIWIKEANHISTDYDENDSDGNCWAKDIFEKNGEYFAVESINGKPTSHIKVDKDGKAVKDGNFAPKKVSFTRYNKNGEQIKA
jgi:6-phosphogluconolactonase (cycloisomerase 2 family)